ncbi:MAG: AraC family transcriptional regulator [Cyclobacteriaceae bacterium]
MILKEFPDINWLRKQIETRFENQTAWDGKKLSHPGWPTVILNTQAKKTLRENIVGPLSLFTNRNGKSVISVKGKQVVVTENTFFVSNPAQSYTLHIPEAAETFNIHVGEKTGEEVWHEAIHSNNYLLDYPHEISTSIELQNQLCWRTESINLIIDRLTLSENEMQEQELIGELVFQLLNDKIKLLKNSTQLSATKISTREEIVRRLHIASDFIYSHFDQPLSLDLLSEASFLSKFHLLRLFKEYFHETPHQFITRLRLEKSIEHLKTTHYSVKEISQKVGIEDPSSFSRLFRNHFGVYPSQFTA